MKKKIPKDTYSGVTQAKMIALKNLHPVGNKPELE